MRQNLTVYDTLRLKCVKVVLFMGFLGFANQSFGQETADAMWTFSQIRVDANQDDTLDYEGQEVTITGIANIESGLLHEHFLQAFIQNDSAGISVFAMEIDEPFKPGDSLVVRGKVQRYNGLAEVHASSYEVFKGVGKEPSAVPLEKTMFSPEEYLGMLVEGEGRIIEKGTVYNGKYFRLSLTDTTSNTIMIYVSNFHSQYKQFDFDVLSIGDKVAVKGVMSEYDPDFPQSRTYKVFLRTPKDLKYVGLLRYYLFWLSGGLLVLTILIVGWILILQQQVGKKTEQIQSSLNEKDVLLREIHHRVKNSLAIVSGLLGMQMESTESEEAREVLQDSQARIQSIALIHEKLYSTDSLSDIKVHNYLEELAESIHSTFIDYDNAVELKYDLEPIRIDIEKAIPCGLLINELVVNAFKHAFKEGEPGILEVSLKKSKDKIKLTVADNGPGVPEDFTLDNTASLGSMLIQTFAAQLEADIEIVNREKGAAFTFLFDES